MIVAAVALAGQRDLRAAERAGAPERASDGVVAARITLAAAMVVYGQRHCSRSTCFCAEPPSSYGAAAMSTATVEALAGSRPHARRWFEGALGAPTPAQTQGWPPIAAGEHTLLCAPTGSGKTLAAFLWFLDRLMTEPGEGLRVLYVSPLKALNYDVERNLRAPLAGIRASAAAAGIELPAPGVAVRTGDTPPEERRRMLRTPPDILITTPESLYLLLTSRAREMLHRRRGRDRRRGARGRGDQARRAHGALARASRRPRRARSAARRAVGHAATARGDRALRRRRPRACASSTPACARSSTCASRCRPTTRPTRRAGRLRPGRQRRRLSTACGPRSTPSCSSSCEPPLDDLFVNSRRMAERSRCALNELSEEPVARAHHGSLSRRRAARSRRRSRSGTLPVHRRHLLARAGIDMGAVDLVLWSRRRAPSRAACSASDAPAITVGGPSRGRCIPSIRGDLDLAALMPRGMLRGRGRSAHSSRTIPLDILCVTDVAIPVAAQECFGSPRLHGVGQAQRQLLPRATRRMRCCARVPTCFRGATRRYQFADLRPRIVWDRELRPC